MVTDDVREQISELEQRALAIRRAISERKRAGRSIDDLAAEHRELTCQIKALSAHSVQAETDTAQDACGNSCQTDIVRDTRVFLSLRDEWNALNERSDTQSPYRTWEWLYPWWERFGNDKQLRLIMVRDDDGTLVGLGPMMLGTRRRNRRILHRRTLALVGTGEGPLANDLGFITDRRLHEVVTTVIWSGCEQMSIDWDQVALDDICLAQPTWHSLITQTLTPAYTAMAQTHRLGVVGSLPESFEACVQQMPSDRRRRNLRSALRKLDAIPQQVVFRRIMDSAEAAPYVALLSRLSAERQCQKGRASSWVSEAFGTFVTRAAALMSDKQRLRVDVLEIGDQVAAVVLGFVLNNAYHGFQSGFDARFAEHSPNHCLWARCIEACIGEGIEVFDFGAGEHDYKIGYFPGRKPTGCLVISKNQPGPSLQLGIEMVTRAAKMGLKALRR